jgi:GT2 family glycosyltransferase
MASPTVSVVIPAYNAAAYLPASIASVQAQSWEDWEALIIDDGSSDDTAKLVRSYQRSDPRIHLISTANQGVSSARNLGIHHSRGAYVAFLDADDVWRPAKLSLHLEHLHREPQLGMSFDRVEFLSADGVPSGQLSTSRLTDLQPYDFLCENPTTTTSTWVVPRAIFPQVGEFRAEMSYCEDLEWLLRLRCRGWRIAGIPQVLTGYRTVAVGLSSDLKRMESGWNQLVDHARSYAPSLIRRHYFTAQAIHLRYLARRSLRMDASAAADGLDFMVRSQRSDPALLLRQPRRTILTLLAVLLRSCYSTILPAPAKKSVTQ